MVSQARAGARLLVNLNASPYSQGRREERLAVLGERVAETGCPIVYVNQIGGQDELVFDGASLVMGSGGTVVASAEQFVEEVLVADVDVGADGWHPTRGGRTDRGQRRLAATGGRPRRGRRWPPTLDPEAEVYEALVLGTRDYVGKNGFTDAVIGLSGRHRLVPGGGHRRRRPGRRSTCTG